MAHLDLRLLGPPEIRRDGHPLSFTTRKTLALLIYLVVEGVGGTPMQPRDRLATLFWPESDSSRGRAALRNTLRYLGNALSTGNEGDTPHLIIERSALGFDFDSEYSLDLEMVEAAGGARRAAPLQEAVAVCRGDFLAGFSLGDAPDFDDWARFQREVWHRRFDTIFDRLSRLQLDGSEVDRAIETARRWVVHDPVTEAAHRRLMRAQLAAGNRSGALQTYVTCWETLAHELGMEPAPATKALAAQIRQSLPETTVQTARARTARLSSLDRVPLVGRADEFEALVESYYRAARGEPQAVVIVGEAGIGKSRLLAEFIRWATAHGADVLPGRGFETGTHPSYQTLIDLLRARVDRVNAPEDLLSDTWLAELSRLLPELRDRYPDLPAPAADDDVVRSRLLEAIARLVTSLAAQTPLVLAIDDVQWADTPSRETLHYTCRRCVELGAPALVVIAVRQEALDPLSVAQEPEVAEWLRELDRVAPLIRFTLTPLGTEDTLQLAEALTRSNVQTFKRSNVPTEKRFAGWLYTETSGHPFYLVETVKDLVERGYLREERDDEGEPYLVVAEMPVAGLSTAPPASVPDRVRQVITARLNRLSPPAFSLLAASAVLGHGFTFELLCEVAGLGEDEGLVALDELLRSQLLQEAVRQGSPRVAGEPLRQAQDKPLRQAQGKPLRQAQGKPLRQAQGKPTTAHTDGPYIFAHDKIRDVVYTEAGDARRRIFHRRALAALERHDAPPAELAHHALAAGQTGAAYRHSLAAGDAALEVFAAREAIRHYEQARDLEADRVPSDVRHLYLRLGRACELAGDYDGALANYDELEKIAEDQGDKELQLAALMARTTVYAAPTQHYDPEQVDILTQRALPLAHEMEDHAAEARILWNLMLLNLFTGNTRQAIEDGEASLAIAREHDLREQMAYSLHDLHRAYLAIGEVEQGLERLREARALWRELDDKAMLADGLVVEAGFLSLVGEFDRALAFCHEALALSQSIDNLWNQSFSRLVMTLIYFERGEYGKAIEAGAASIELGKQAGFMVPMVGLGPIVGWVYALCGDAARGLEWVVRAEEQAGQMHESLLVGPLAVRGALQAMAGDLSAAEASIQDARAHFNPEAIDSGALMLAIAAPRVALAHEEYARALEAADEMLAVMRTRGARCLVADVLLLQGCALRALGRTDVAKQVLAEAREIAEALTARRVWWEILVELATIAAEEGDAERAAGLRQQADDLVAYIAGQVYDPELRRSFLQTLAASERLP